MVLIAGEDPNDTHSIMHLMRAILPTDANYAARPLRRPPILRRNAAPAKRRSMAEEVAALASAFLRTHLKVVTVAHRDCDELEPAHLAEAEALESDLRDAGAPNPIAATPAWEIETWWMLFPEALRATRGCWKAIDYAHLDVGMIQHSKERLVRDLRPVGRRRNCPDYRESDSVIVAQQVHRLGLAQNHERLKADSLREFRKKLLDALA